MFDRIASLEDAPLPSAERGRWATFACLAVLAAVYAVEALASGGVLSIDGLTLLAMGAENRRLVVEGGELYRVFSAALLHANLEHVALNGLALGMAGWYLEPAVGWGWMLLLLGTGTVGGSVLSLTLNPPDMPSVGASSAIMAVFAAGMIAGLNRFPDSKERTKVLLQFARVLIPALFPVASGTHGDLHIDYGGHLGGALAGCAIAPLLLRHWTGGKPGPDRWPAIDRGAVAVIALFVLSAAAAAVWGPTRAGLRDLAPPHKVPDEKQLAADPEGVSKAFVEKYPRDPRARLMRGIALTHHGRDLAGAEAQLRAADEIAQQRRALFGPGLETVTRVMLVAVLLDEKKENEARTLAEPLCALPDANVPKGIAGQLGLLQARLCLRSESAPSPAPLPQLKLGSTPLTKSSAGAPVEKRAARSAHRLSVDQVRETLEENRGVLQGCIDEALQRDPNLRVGKIHLATTVVRSGRVTSVKIDKHAMDESSLGICLKRAAKAIVFPSFRGDPFNVDIPIVVTAGN